LQRPWIAALAVRQPRPEPWREQQHTVARTLLEHASRGADDPRRQGATQWRQDGAQVAREFVGTLTTGFDQGAFRARTAALCDFTGQVRIQVDRYEMKVAATVRPAAAYVVEMEIRGNDRSGRRLIAPIQRPARHSHAPTRGDLLGIVSSLEIAALDKRGSREPVRRVRRVACADQIRKACGSEAEALAGLPQRIAQESIQSAGGRARLGAGAQDPGGVGAPDFDEPETGELAVGPPDGVKVYAPLL
jgi:hypothetical protein